MNYLTTPTETAKSRVASLTVQQIIDLDAAAFRAEWLAAKTARTFNHFEFDFLPADDDALRVLLFRKSCSDATATEQSAAAYFRPNLLSVPMSEGLSFADALASIEPPHQHDFDTVTEGGFDPIMGTGRQTVTHTCRTCGHIDPHTTVRNWSGD